MNVTSNEQQYEHFTLMHEELISIKPIENGQSY